MVITSKFFFLLKIHENYYYCSTTHQERAERTLTFLPTTVPCCDSVAGGSLYTLPDLHLLRTSDLHVFRWYIINIIYQEFQPI